MPAYLEYRGSAGIGGHYKVYHKSGTVAATIGAAGHLARIRWTDPTLLLALLKIRVGITINGAVTTATQFALQAVIVRGFSVDFTTAITNTSLAAVGGTNQARTSGGMKASRMGTAGPGICTTTVMSGQTLTADAAPFAGATLPGIVPVTATGTAVALPVGFGTTMHELYKADFGSGEHPITLSQNEGVVIQPSIAGPADGTFVLHVEWTWAEVPGL